MSELFSGLVAGWGIIDSPTAALLLVVGLVVGFIVGVIPGFGGASAVAILLPFAVLLGPGNAVILMLAIYCGTAFGGSIPAILLNIPGEAGSAVVAIDGYPLAHSGRPHLAVGISRMASMVGGVIGLLVTIVLIYPLSEVAVQIGPAEMFVVALIAIVTCSSLVGDSIVKGLIAGLLGMLIAMTGVGPVSARPRFDFGILELYSGISLIPVVLGLFAFGELIMVSKELIGGVAPGMPTVPGGGTTAHGVVGQLRRLVGLDDLGELVEGMKITLRHKVTLLQSSLMGVAVGAIPGMGSSVAGFLAYGHAKDRSKDPESFGKGNPVGIIAPEACDNAVSGGLLVPVLTLGVPGNGTSAVLLAALYLNGVEVGPRLLGDHPDLAYGALLAALVASILILPLGIVLAGPLIQFTKVRLEVLIPIVLVLSVIGAYTDNNSMVAVVVALAFGLLAVVLRIFEYPIIPLFLGFILGPLTESSFVRALALSRDNVSIFWDSVPSKVLLAALALVVLSSNRRLRRQKRRRRDMAEATS
jgi:putative tricarboxylic transport membrane protein